MDSGALALERIETLFITPKTGLLPDMHFRSFANWFHRLLPSVSKRSLLSKRIGALRKKTARRFFYELLETRMVLASDWQNPLWNLDVDFDGTVSPLDALAPINAINRQNDGGTTIDFSQPVGENNYLDVDGDLALSPLDVLNVVNYLNSNATPLLTDLALSVDSGDSTTDKITNNPTVIGSVFDFTAVKPTVQARLDRGLVVPLTIAGDMQLQPSQTLLSF